MRFKPQTEVLVVGAGPVGLFTALCMAERGLGVEIIDKDWRGTLHSYALALHPGSLRLLSALGLADELLAKGQRIARVAIYEQGARVGALDVAALGGPHPFLLIVPQSALERTLAKRLESRKIKVHWNHQATAIEQDGGEVRVKVAQMEKCSVGYPVAHTEWSVVKEFDTRVAFVVGADGYYSSVRRACGARFEHHGTPEAFSVYEFPAALEFQDEARLALHDSTLNVVWPLGDARGRFSFQVEKESPAPPSLEGLQQLARARAPWFRSQVDQIYWSSTIVFERRLVDRFGNGRIWLAGDAAHITGPVGVQSMNVGLREGHELAERCAAIQARGGSALDELQDFERQRQAEWRRLLGLAGAPQAGATTPAWAARHAARLLPCIPASGAELDALLDQLGLRIGSM
jgi:2-polyprenyl-6-methoxyphenol hydroxylase-like FAD-dependent oxidoreductase